MSLFTRRVTSIVGACAGAALFLPNLASGQMQPATAQDVPSDQIVIAYIQPENSAYQEMYDLLQKYHALENVREILNPIRLREQLTIKTMECGVINCRYGRENFKPTVTICYEFLRHILESLSNEAAPDGVTPSDAAVGQFLWVTLHEVGHATFDILDVPIFGHAEDAADNFATYIMLQFGREPARRLVLGAAWAWRAYLGDYKKNPVVPLRLSAFADEHGLPQERFYNLSCLAFGAHPDTFAELQRFLPLSRAQNCVLEYRSLVRAFEKQIGPYVDQQMARHVDDTDWVSTLETKAP